MIGGESLWRRRTVVTCTWLLVVLLAIGAIVTWKLVVVSPLAVDLDMAQKRWTDRPFHHYRVVIRRQQYMVRCVQELEMQDDTIVQILRNNCRVPPLTINDVFGLIRQRIDPPECDYVNCRCPIVYKINATYDQALGYPVLTAFSLIGIDADASIPDYWLLSTRDDKSSNCSILISLYREEITVDQVVALPETPRH